MCVETNVTSGLVVDRREAQHICDCLVLLGIPWEGESQGDHNQNLDTLDPETGEIQVTLKLNIMMYYNLNSLTAYS